MTVGSSPLTRGKQYAARSVGHDGGLIPAHAGKTAAAWLACEACAAHPRSRGENQECDHDGHRPRWLIPAHAGKTNVIDRCAVVLEAHPRSRGENVGCTIRTDQGEGSSPLTRGKPRGTTPTYLHPRLIPAHAGKTGRPRVRRPALAAHPRSRGENRVLKPGGYLLAGSSPLTRGKLPVPLGDVAPGRLIPAHAGKTARGQRSCLRAAAHPRSRGENRGLAPPGLGGQGSSPLTRGKHVAFVAHKLADRFIPAHAGKTSFQ